MTGARNHASHIWLEAWVAQGPKPRAAYMQWDISRWRWWGIEVTTRETIISALLLTPFFKHWPGASLETDDDDNSHKIHNHWQLLCAFQLFYFLFSNVLSGHKTFKEQYHFEDLDIFLPLWIFFLTFMDLYGTSWTFTDLCGSLWTFVDLSGPLWTFVDFCGPL